MNWLTARPFRESFPNKKDGQPRIRLARVTGDFIRTVRGESIWSNWIFDKKPGFAGVDVVEACQDYLNQMRANGTLDLPAG